MSLLLFLSISLVATTSAAFVVTRGMTVRSVLLISAVALMAALAFALLQAPYLAAVEALVGAALVPGLVLVSLRVSERASSGDARPSVERISRLRRIVGGTVAGAVFIALVVTIRWSPTIQGPAFELEAIPPRDVASVGESLLETQVISFEIVAALVLVSLVAAVRLTRGAFRDSSTGTSRGTELT